MSQAVFTNDIFPQPKFHQATIPSNGFEKQHSIVANSLMSDAIEGEHVPILEKHPQLLLMVIFHVPQ
jgi:hypothetical protein